MIRHYYREGKGEKRRPLEYLLYFFVIIALILFLAPAVLEILEVSNPFNNQVLGILTFMTIGSFFL